MKKSKFLLLAFLIFLNVFTIGCNKKKDDGSGYTFNCSLLGNPQNLDPQLAQDTSSYTIIRNMFSGLLKLDENGVLSNDVAENYTISNDGLSYVFNLRKNCYWYYANYDNSENDNEKINVTAKDFVFAFQRIFDPKTNSPYKEQYKCIKNAEKIINGELDYQKLGIKSIDDYTLEIQLDFVNADFLTLLTLPPAMPCHQDFFESTKGRYGLDEKSVISNGAFYVTQWFYDPYGPENILIMKKNLINSENNKTFPSTLIFSIDRNYSTQLENFNSEKIDYLECDTIPEKFNNENYTINTFKSSTTGLIFNLSHSYFSNENIRKAFRLSIDRNDITSSAYGIIPPDATLLNKSYRELVSEQLLAEYNPQEATKAFENGSSQIGSSPYNIKILTTENLLDNDTMNKLAQNWRKLFNIYIGFEIVDNDEYYQRLKQNDFQIALYTLSTDYNSVFAIFDKFLLDAKNLGYSLDNVEKQLQDAYSRLNLNQCVSIFQKMELEIINANVFVPIVYNNKYLIHKNINQDIFYIPFTNQIDMKYAKYISN